MPIDLWIAFCLTEAVLCFTPGPAVLLVVSYALSGGRREGLGAALGVLTANTLYFALSAAGVGALLLASNELFTALKWAGAGYLVWLGLRMLLRPSGKAGAVPAPARGGAFWKGLVVQGANPKALVFFVALLPQFLSPSHPLATQIVVLGVSSLLIELGALALYATVVARAGHYAGDRLRGPLERVGGAFLVAAGAKLAAARDA